MKQKRKQTTKGKLPKKETDIRLNHTRYDVSEFCIYDIGNKKNGCIGDKCRRPYFNSQEQSGIQQTKGSHTPATVEKKR